MAGREGDAAPVGQFTGPYKWTKTDPLWIPVLTDDHKAQFEKLKRDLDVERRAHDDGVENLPTAQETALNDTQSGIQNRIFKGICLLNAFLAAELDKVHQAMTAPDLEIDAELKKSEADTILGQVDAQSELVTTCLNKFTAERQLRHFRVTHSLTHRPAVYRQSELLFFAILIGLAVLESIFNAMLLQQISEQGFVGGVGIALMISAINVALGVLGGGVGWRLLGHRYRWARVIGGVVAAFTFIAALGWNILVAHFREVALAAVSANRAAAEDAAPIDPTQSAAAPLADASMQPGSETSVSLTDSAADAFGHIREHGLFGGLDTIYSWMLLGLGVLVFLFVCFESWDGMADQYWGYKKVDKRCVKATEEFDEEFDDYREAVDERLGDFWEQVASEGAAASNNIRRADAAAGLAEQRYSEVQESQADWVNQGNRLLTLYRNENERVRNPEVGLPRYWSHLPTVQDYLAIRYSGGQIAPQEAEALDRVPQVLEEIRSRRTELRGLQEANQRALREIQRHIQQLRKGLATEVGKLRESVENAARRRLEQTGGGGDDSGKPT